MPFKGAEVEIVEGRSRFSLPIATAFQAGVALVCFFTGIALMKSDVSNLRGDVARIEGISQAAANRAASADLEVSRCLVEIRLLRELLYQNGTLKMPARYSAPMSPGAVELAGNKGVM